MSCRETRPLLPLFFDGELEPRQMRAVALHSTRCPDCEQELRQLESLQELVVAHINAAVEEVDLARIWGGLEPRLAPRRPALLARVRSWWDERELGWRPLGTPAFAAAALAVLLALGMWWRAGEPGGPGPELASSRMDNSAVVDSMQSSVDSVALVTDEETNTTLLWIMDDDAAIDPLADQWDAER